MIGEVVEIQDQLELEVGKGTIYRLPKTPNKIVLSNPGIAYLKFLGPKEMEIIGRNVGRSYLYVWYENDGQEDEFQVIGNELVVGLPAPPYFGERPTIEVVNGSSSQLLYIGSPREIYPGAVPGRLSGIETDMPEPCLVPGCL
jgi:hypothetical protein